MKLFALLLLASGLARAAPSVLVFGDSLSAGYGIARESGWVALLGRRLAGYDVVNASVSGETTDGGLTRLPAVLAAHRPALVILELGANDGLRGLPLEQTGHNLERMVDLIRKGGARPLLVGMQLPPNYGPAYERKFRALYSDVAKTKKVRLVPFLLAGMADDRSRFQADGLHPDAEAQPVLLNNVWRELRPMLKEK
jgi:acyl-CoA thioesterase-1